MHIIGQDTPSSTGTHNLPSRTVDAVQADAEEGSRYSVIGASYNASYDRMGRSRYFLSVAYHGLLGISMSQCRASIGCLGSVISGLLAGGMDSGVLYIAYRGGWC